MLKYEIAFIEEKSLYDILLSTTVLGICNFYFNITNHLNIKLKYKELFMQVHPISTINLNNKNFKKTNLTQNSVQNSNVSFKSWTSYLIVLVAREGIGALKSTKKVKYLKELEEGINRSYDKEHFAETLRALSKTPDSFYDYDHQGWTLWVGSWSGKDPQYVNELRDRALYKFSSLDDNNSGQIIQVKKEFLQSFMDNGHEISQQFLDNFKNLKDTHYSSFKINLIDTALYSKTYNTARINKSYFHPCYPSECNSIFSGQPFRDYNMRGEVDATADRNERSRIAMYNNLKLISVLDQNLYRNFIANRRQAIDELKNNIEKYFDKEYKERGHRPHELYADFINNIKPI